jgi:hypothetical protein
MSEMMNIRIAGNSFVKSVDFGNGVLGKLRDGTPRISYIRVVIPWLRPKFPEWFLDRPNAEKHSYYPLDDRWV